SDLSDQLAQLQNMGGLGGVMGLLPGVGKAKQQMAAAGMDDKMLVRQRAIISSMTPEERTKPDILKASRKRRIAAGSGVDVAEVNRLLKMHRAMADAMKAAGKSGRGGGMAGLMGKMGAGMGGMPPGAAQQAMKMMQAGGGGLPGGLPGLPGAGGGLPGLG